MYSLQTSVIVNDREYTITNNGDFRMVLDCMAAMRDDEMGESYRTLASLLIFYNEFNSVEDITNLPQSDVETLLKEMFKFINCGQEDSPGAHTDYSVVDWELDSQMICAGVNNVAKTEVRSLEYLHWWTFIGYYMSIGESTLSTVVGIRNKICKHKKLEKWEAEFKRDNPQYFNWKSQSVESREADRLIREIWNNGGE